MEDIGIDGKGIRVGWKFIAHWGWRILEGAITLLLAGHIYMTHMNAVSMSTEQQKQNMRLDRIERAISACLDRQLDCEAQKSERLTK
jgi:hypothetical protein